MTDVAAPVVADALSETIERTLVLVKPDGVRRGLSGEILRRVEVGRASCRERV